MGLERGVTVDDYGGDEAVVGCLQEVGVENVEVAEEVSFEYFPAVTHIYCLLVVIIYYII